jgi:hypothetical protein
MRSSPKLWERVRAYFRNERPRQNVNAVRGRIWEKKPAPARKGAFAKASATLDIKVVRADGTVIEYKDIPASAIELKEKP